MSVHSAEIQIERFTRKVGEESIATESYSFDGNYRCLILHGAGQSSIALLQTFRHFLAANGLGNIAFDFSGHGNSSSHKPNSLEKRFHEAQSALFLLNQASKKTLISFSMSGEIAIRLAAIPENNIENLVLFAPALYDAAAFSVEFGPEFTEMIRKPFSFRQSQALSALKKFHGRLTLVLPEHDEVIPKEVAELILANANPTAKKTAIVLPDQSHATARRMSTDLEFSRECAQLVVQSVLSLN